MLMELERHAMLMYTSCGWFFDDISGIETVQVIAYAGRVLQLASELFGKRAATLEKKFIDRLATAKSNIPEQQDGAAVYNRYIRTMQVGLEQVAAHYAISSIFTSYPDEADLFSYSVAASPGIRLSPAACASLSARRSSAPRSPKPPKPWPSAFSTSATRTSPPW